MVEDTSGDGWLARLKQRPAVQLVRATVREFGEDNVPRLGAAISFFALLSMAPLLVIAIAIAGLVLGDAAAQGEVVGQLSGVLGPQAAEFIEATIERAALDGGSLLSLGLGSVALIVAASNLFAHLQASMDRIWDVESAQKRTWRDFVRDRLVAFVMVLLVGVLLLVALVAGALLSFVAAQAEDVLPGGVMLWRLLDVGASLTLLTLVFALLFKYLPEVDVGWRSVWIGAVITSALFVVGRYAISLYLAYSSGASVYGAAGSLVVILIWIFYSAQIFFLGAEFTSVYARYKGDLGAPRPGMRKRRSLRRRVA